MKRTSLSSLSKTIVLRHILVWAIFITYEVFYVQFTAGVHASFFRFSVYYLLNIGLFYFNALVILDFAFFKTPRPYWFAIGLILLEIMAYLVIKFLIDYLMLASRPVVPADWKLLADTAVVNIWRAIYFIGFSIAYWAMQSFIRYKERSHVMETGRLKDRAEKLELENKYIIAENAYLQTQVSPHLLFNSLNFIYNSVYRVSEKAGRGVMLLADLLRYSLNSGVEDQTVLLSEEIEQIRNLIELNRLRYDDALFLRFQKKGKLRNIRILPLVLISFVENMVKHGDLGDAKVPGRIDLACKDRLLLFKTVNKKRKSSPYPKGGLGLKNVEKRLSNYYQERFLLDILEDEEFFTVTLEIYL